MSDDSRREKIIAAMIGHFKATIEASAGCSFDETDVHLPVKSFEGYADAVLALPATNPGAEMFEAAQERIRVKADRRSNPGAGVKCSWCGGVLLAAPVTSQAR